MSDDDTVGRVGDAIHPAVATALDALAAGTAELHPLELLEPGTDPFAGAEAPAVVAHAASADGATGAAFLLLTVPGARRLAAVLGAIDEEEAEFGGAALGDRELGAVRDAAAAVLAAIGPAASGVLDRPVTFRTPAAQAVDQPADVSERLEPGAGAAVVPLTILGEAARIVLLVPANATASAPAFVADPPPTAPAGGPSPLDAALRSVNVRVWAELGRTRMPTGDVVALPSGEIVELDHDAEDAVDLYVDGQRYATGRLVVTDDESWGVRIERILAPR